MITTLHFHPDLHADETVSIQHHDGTAWVSVDGRNTHVAAFVGADDLRRLNTQAQAALREIEAQEKRG